MKSQNTEKLSITLPAEMVRMIREKVRSGAYGSESEVIREALRVWSEPAGHLSSLDAAIARGLADSESGRVQDIETVRDELHQRFRSTR